MKPVKIGLISALPQEWASLRGAMEDVHAAEHAQIRFDVGMLDGREVVLAETGMGKVNAALVSTLLVHSFRCGTVIFSGVAGGLDPTLNVGDVVVADRVVQHDAGLIVDDGLHPYQAGHVPFINPTDRFGYDLDTPTLSKVKDALRGLNLPSLSLHASGHEEPARIVFGTVLSGDQYLHSAQARTRLHNQFGACAIEMEGGAVAQVCEAFGVDWLIIRGLSDLAGEESKFEFERFASEVATSSCIVLRRLLPVF